MQFIVGVAVIFSVISFSLTEKHYGYGRDRDNAHTGYKFAYGVHDPNTGDHKSQYEHREGDHVIGGYALKEPDGTYRIVRYKAGPHSGFEAVVERSGVAHHPAHYGSGHHGNDIGKEGGTSYVVDRSGVAHHPAHYESGHHGNEIGKEGGTSYVVDRSGVAHHPAHYGSGHHENDVGKEGATSYVEVIRWGDGQDDDKDGYH